MSRSHKKTPIVGFTKKESEKMDKQKANRKLRRLTKESLKKQEEILPLQKGTSNVWDFAKDGKQYLKAANKKDLRK